MKSLKPSSKLVESFSNATAFRRLLNIIIRSRMNEIRMTISVKRIPKRQINSENM